MKKTFSIRKLFSDSWKDYQKYWGVIILIGLTMTMVSGLSWIGTSVNLSSGMLISSGFSVISSWLAGVWLSIGFINFLLNIVDGKQARFKDIFYGVKSVEQFVYFILVSFVFGLLVFLGSILFIIPGIVIALGYGFAHYYIAENRLGFSNAFKSSWEITTGNRWKIFLLGIITALFNMLGFLALGVGLIITIPMTKLMYVRLFRELEGIPVPDAGESYDSSESRQKEVQDLIEETKLA